MVTEYHERIQRIILDLGKDLMENGNTVKKVRQGSSRPIHINHPTKDKNILYKPDAYYERKDGRIIAFEVLDSQSCEKTIADVTRSILNPNVRHLCLITKDDRSRNEVVKTCDVVLSSIADSADVPKEELLQSVSVVKVTVTKSKKRKEVEKLLSIALTDLSPSIMRKK